MKALYKTILVILTVALLWLAPQAHALIVNFQVGADDYAALTIDGSPIATLNSGGWGSAFGSYDMTPGIWYDITIDYKNRWGSNGLALWWDQPYHAPGVFAEGIGGIVPDTYLRSSDGAGGYISGLHADYYDLSGNFLFAVDGEGPIAHGNADGVHTFYENEFDVLWAGTYTFWGTFEERLTGEIRIDPVPEPATMLLLGSALLVLAGIRRKFK